MAKFSQVIAAGASFTALLGWLPVADAAIIRSPISVTTDSSGNINSTIDQSGLTIGFNSGVDDFDDYFALDPLHSVIFSSWVGDYGDITPTFDYDLGHIFEIDRLALWNGHHKISLHEFDLLTSIDGVNFSLATSLSASPAGAFDIIPYPAAIFELAPVTARFVRLDVKTCNNSSDVLVEGGRCQFGEIAFSTTSAPEPATVLGLATLALAGGTLLRRQRR